MFTQSCVFTAKPMNPTAMSRFIKSVKQRLSPQPRTNPELRQNLIQPRSDECALFVSHGPFGIVDLGASQTIIGDHQVPELLAHLPEDIRAKVREVPCKTIFRFGNSSTVTCSRAMLVPLAKWNVKICIVNTRTPCLISNNVFRTLEAQIDTASDHVKFSKRGIKLPLNLSEKKLYLLDFCELVRLGNSNMAGKVEVVNPNQVKPIMSSVDEEQTVYKSPVTDPQPVQSSLRPCEIREPETGSFQTVSDGHLNSRRSFSSCDTGEEIRRVQIDVLCPVNWQR